MTTPPSVRARIVVGIDATPLARPTVLWAAEEARLRHGALVITHIGAASTVPGAGRKSLADEHQLLADNAEAASAWQPSVPVGTQLLRGTVSEALIAFSRRAALLVIGVDQARSRASHGALGPIEDRVVAHAQCPVVVLSGRPSSQPGTPSHALAVLLPGAVAGSVLDLAAAESRLRSTGLRVLVVDDPLRAGSLDTGGDPVQRAVLTLRQQYPDLRLDVVHSQGDPEEAVLDQARSADFLVLASEHSEQPWGIRVGVLAGPVMRLAACPVFLVNEQTGVVHAA